VSRVRDIGGRRWHWHWHCRVDYGGAARFLLNQDVFQQSILIAPVLAVITACDPLVSVTLAHFWLDERLSSSPRGPQARYRCW
jgi:hypothetical protein